MTVGRVEIDSKIQLTFKMRKRFLVRLLAVQALTFSGWSADLNSVTFE